MSAQLQISCERCQHPANRSGSASFSLSRLSQQAIFSPSACRACTRCSWSAATATLTGCWASSEPTQPRLQHSQAYRCAVGLRLWLYERIFLFTSRFTMPRHVDNTIAELQANNAFSISGYSPVIHGSNAAMDENEGSCIGSYFCSNMARRRP